MNIELKRLKVYDRMSEETTAYNADILLDGRVVGEASNTGKGEADRIYWTDREAGKRIENYVHALPPEEFNGVKLPMNMELYLGNLIEEHRFRAMCKKHTLVKMNEGIFKLNTLDRAKVTAYMEKKYPGAVYEVMNDRYAPASV